MSAACIHSEDTILNRLFHHAANSAERLAYRFLRENAESDTLTFGELARRVRHLAAHFRRHVAAGDRALLLYPPGLEFIEAFLGCLAAGVIAVPAYPPRKNRNADRLRAIVADAQPRLILTTRPLLSSFESDGAGPLPGLTCLATDDLGAADGGDWEPPAINPDTVAFLQYTSGSTGAPRGVVVTHGNIAANEEQVADSFCHTPDSVMVSWLPLFHDMGLIGGVLQPLYVGFPAVLLSPVDFLREPACWLRAITRYRGTTTGAPNFAYDHCARHVTEEQKQGLDLRSLAIAYNGAEPVRPETLDRFAAAFARCGFRPEAFFPCYGLAESTLFVSGGPPGRVPTRLRVCGRSLEAHRLQEITGDSADARTLVSSGRIADGTRAVIVDPETRAACAPGRIGEVWLASASVAVGYWNRPEETRETFQAQAADTGAGPFLRTGDLGFVRDGELFITGRLKDLIIIRGRNLYPQDVEAAVERVVPFAKANAVAAFSTEGEGGERLAVVIEADRALVQTAQAAARKREEAGASGDVDRENGGIIQPGVLVGRVRDAVSSEFEVPVHTIAFVRPGSFPRTSSGKVQRGVCRSRMLTEALDTVHVWSANGSTLGSAPTPACSERTITETPAVKATASSGATNGEVQTRLETSRVEAERLISWLRDYSGRRLNTRLMDERRCVPPHIVLDFGNQGLFGLQVPKIYGGLDLRTVDTLRVFEQLAAIDLTLALMVGIHNGLGLRPILNYGSDSLRDELLPGLATGRQLAAFAISEPGAGSDPNAIQSIAQATSNGWRVRAEKRWIGLGSWAGVITLFAKALDSQGAPLGTIALAIREHTGGLRHGPESLTMGVRGIVQNTVYLDDALVPDGTLLGGPGQGMAIAQDAMMFCRLGLAAASVGAMKRCAQLMVRYADRRQVATGRLLENPVSLARLEDIVSATDATEALAYKVAGWIDEGANVPVEAYVACKTSGPEFLWQATDYLVQLLGGRGYVETNVAPQLLRDARLLRIFEGPTETLNSYLGANVLHRGESVFDLLANGFQSSEIAQELRAAAECLRDRAVRSVRSAGSGAPRQWACFQAGELATAAIVWAAASDRSRRQTSSQTVEWARGRFVLLRDTALALHGERPGLLTAGHVADRVGGYEASIGDIEQHLPGEDDRLDSYLSKQGSGQAHLAPTIPRGDFQAESAVQPAPERKAQQDQDWHQVIHDLILEWLRSEVDARAEAIDYDTPFTSLGLDSVGATTVALEVERATGLRVNPDLIYEFQTISQLCGFLMTHGVAVRTPFPDAPSTVNGKVSETDPPREVGAALWFVQRLVERNQRIDGLKAAGQYPYGTEFTAHNGARSQVDGRPMLMMASFGYLGLIGHPEVNEAAKAAIDRYGAGSHGARLIAGTTDQHRELERQLAAFLGAEDVVTFNNGYVTNLATVQAVVGPGDVVIGDEYNHASIVDGCVISGATFRTFRHNDVGHLEALLAEEADRRKLVVVDGVYSMEGDLAPLPEIVLLCRRYDARLMVDEAHSLGVVGATGRGVQEHFGLPPNAIDIKMGNLSKALGGQGGFIAGRAELIDFLKHHARGSVFSTALGPPLVAAALKALEILRREPARVERLHRNARRLTADLRTLGFRTTETQSAIIPLLCRTEEDAFQMTARCRAEGVYVVPIVYPAVPMNAPRLRLNVMATHTDADLDFALDVLGRAGRQVGLIR